MKLETKVLRVAAAVLAGAIASGCTIMGEQRVEGWPQLTVVEHHVPHKEMRDRCGKYLGPFTSPEACAEFDLTALRCDIWLSADFPPPAFIVNHELKHCLGYDHEGEHELRDILANYQDAQKTLQAEKALAARKTLASSGSEDPRAISTP